MNQVSPRFILQMEPIWSQLELLQNSLILAAIRSNDQLLLQQQITEFRLSLLKDPSLTNIFSPSYGLDSFHAQTDYPQVKERFLTFITTWILKLMF